MKKVNSNESSFPQLLKKIGEKKVVFRIFYKEKPSLQGIFANSKKIWIRQKINYQKTALKEGE